MKIHNTVTNAEFKKIRKAIPAKFKQTPSVYVFQALEIQ